MTVLGLLERLARSTSAVAVTEFAYATPLILGLGLSGLEITNLALARMKSAQIASNLSDVLSRSGISDGTGQRLIRERDINDAFAAVARQGGSMDIVNNGRIIVSSLERNPDGGNWIHWRRCYGQLRVTGTLVVSRYLPANDGATGTAFAGMGPSGEEVVAPDASAAVMFVELTYKYQPLIGDHLFGAQTIRSESAFLVRDRRVLTTGSNPSNPTPTVTASAC